MKNCGANSTKPKQKNNMKCSHCENKAVVKVEEYNDLYNVFWLDDAGGSRWFYKTIQDWEEILEGADGYRQTLEENDLELDWKVFCYWWLDHCVEENLGDMISETHCCQNHIPTMYNRFDEKVNVAAMT